MGVTLQIEIPEFDIQRLQAQSAQHGLSLDDFIKNIVRAVATTEPDIPLTDAQERVRKFLTRLSENFDDLSHRLSVVVQLQTVLRALEIVARNNNFRPLSRVAAVLHDTLKHNPIEGFSKEQLTAFQKACQEAIKIDPAKASPREAERHLFRAQLSWLPSLPADALEDDIDD